jgi:hypothetical protein
LDCSRGFVPEVEVELYNTLVSSAPEVIELKAEREKHNPALPSNEKEVASIKIKGKGRKVVVHVSSQVSTHSFTKASVHCTVAPTTVVGSPIATPAPAPDPLAVSSHSGATIPFVPRKRKVVAPDTFATSSKRSSSFSLVENVDMGEFHEDQGSPSRLLPHTRNPN